MSPFLPLRQYVLPCREHSLGGGGSRGSVITHPGRSAWALGREIQVCTSSHQLVITQVNGERIDLRVILGSRTRSNSFCQHSTRSLACSSLSPSHRPTLNSDFASWRQDSQKLGNFSVKMSVSTTTATASPSSSSIRLEGAPPSQPVALVIGGGIAGCAVALFLQRAGIESRVFEAYGKMGGVRDG